MEIMVSQIEIRPSGKKIERVIEAPNSKSITNRALIIAALAEGNTTLRRILRCEDTDRMLASLRKLGIDIKELKADAVEVKGTGGKIQAPIKPLWVGGSGTTMRFLAPFSAFARGKVILEGDSRMRKRPMEDLLKALIQMGVDTKRTPEGDVEVEGRGFLKGGPISMPGETSSQFFTAVLLCAPYCQNGLTITAASEVTSKPYINMTARIMRDFGSEVSIDKGFRKFHVDTKKKYTPREFTIEGDCSNASYFFAAAAINKGRIKVKNIAVKTTAQGDLKFVDVLGRMGCTIKKESDSIEVKGADLKGVEVDMNDMPDVAQTLAIVALFAKGKTVIRGVPNIRYKESDRIKNFITELKKLGSKIEELPDGFIIKPEAGNLKPGVTIDTYNDHRMAMSFSLVGLKVPVKINNPHCVSKTFPDYFDRFDLLRT